MKITRLILFFICVSPCVYGQDTLLYSEIQEDYERRHRTDSLFHFGVELYPKFTGCFATTKTPNAEYFTFSDSRLFALSAGATLKYSIKPWLVVSSGFNIQYLAAQSAVIPADIDGGLLYDYTILYGFKQAEIPLNLELHHKSGLFAGFGTSLTAILWAKQSIVYQTSPVMIPYKQYIQHANSMNYTLNAEAGYSHQLKRGFNQVRFSFSVQRFMKDNMNAHDWYPVVLSIPPLKFMAAGIKLAYLF